MAKSINEIAKESCDLAIERDKIRSCYIGYGILTMGEEMNEVENAFFYDDPEKQSDHLPKYTTVQEEIADVVLAGLSNLHFLGVDPQEILCSKLEFNKKR